MAGLTSAHVNGEQGNPSLPLLTSWLRQRLEVPVSLTWNAGPGVTSVEIEAGEVSISVAREADSVATLTRTGLPDTKVPLPRRDLAALLSEELRRMDPDEAYQAAITNVDESECKS